MWDLYHSRHKVTLNVWYISCQKWVIARICRCVSIIDASAVDLLVRRLLRAGAHVCTALALKAPVFLPPLRQNVSSSSPPQATPSSAHRTMTTSECIFRLLSLLPVLNSVQIVLVTIAKKIFRGKQVVFCLLVWPYKRASLMPLPWFTPPRKRNRLWAILN